MESQIDQLFGDYLFYRRFTAYFKRLQATVAYLREPRLNPERKELLTVMVRWCGDHSLDPRWWLYSLFYARRWNAAPRWDQLVPGTKKTERKALARYAALQDAPLYSERVTSELRKHQQDSGKIYNANRDLAASIENLKRRYIESRDSDRCMREMQTETLGYHPKSTVCEKCPASAGCEIMVQKSVGFDILALRRGEITLDQAMRMEGRYLDGR